MTRSCGKNGRHEPANVNVRNNGVASTYVRARATAARPATVSAATGSTRFSAARTVVGTIRSVGAGVSASNGGRPTTSRTVGPLDGQVGSAAAGHGSGPDALHAAPSVTSETSLRGHATDG